MEKNQELTKREKEILKWHWAGKKHSWIADKFETTKKEIYELILKFEKKKEKEKKLKKEVI